MRKILKVYGPFVVISKLKQNFKIFLLNKFLIFIYLKELKYIFKTFNYLSFAYEVKTVVNLCSYYNHFLGSMGGTY